MRADPEYSVKYSQTSKKQTTFNMLDLNYLTHDVFGYRHIFLKIVSSFLYSFDLRDD